MMGKKNNFILIVLISLLIILSFSTLDVCATAQAPDIVIIEGKRLSIFSNPLESYFELYPDKRSLLTAGRDRVILSSGLWRGYIAYFEIKENKLLLNDIIIEVPSAKKQYGSDEVSVIDNIIPAGQSRLADWYTGYLIVPKGKLKAYVHMGYASLYSKYLVFKIDKGVVIEKVKMTASSFLSFRNKQFEAFKKTDTYSSIVEEMKKEEEKEKEKSTAEELEEFLYEYYSADYTSMIFKDVPLKNPLK